MKKQKNNKETDKTDNIKKREEKLETDNWTMHTEQDYNYFSQIEVQTQKSFEF